MDLSHDIQALFTSQLNDWKLARSNYEALKKVKTKVFPFDGFVIKVQFNPARIQSSSAKVDTKSIKERRCFLCPDNLPAEQKGIPFENDYQVLVNPYPIFNQHFTVPTYEHSDQSVSSRYNDMLDLADKLPDYVVFYNGPKCGASAPDHAHFQVAVKRVMPIGEEVGKISKEIICGEADSFIYRLKNYLRNGFLIQAKDKRISDRFFKQIYSSLSLEEGDIEPMMNILSWKDGKDLFTCVFPREKHRPVCFYAEGEENLLVSPASVDLGGLFIVPQERDFDKITAEDVTRILEEVCINDNKMQIAVNNIRKYYGT